MKLIPHSQEVFEKSHQLGSYAAYVSGAGPTLMSIVSAENDRFEPGMRAFLDENGLTGWRIIRLSIDNQGTHVVL